MRTPSRGRAGAVVAGALTVLAGGIGAVAWAHDGSSRSKDDVAAETVLRREYGSDEIDRLVVEYCAAQARDDADRSAHTLRQVTAVPETTAAQVLDAVVQLARSRCRAGAEDMAFRRAVQTRIQRYTVATAAAGGSGLTGAEAPDTTAPDADDGVTLTTTIQPPHRPGDFPSCEAARQAGRTPLYAGEVGYSVQLDPDLDGVACD